MRISGVIVSLLLALSCPAGVSARETAKTVGEIDFRPPPTAGSIRAVALVVPLMDALNDLEITEERTTTGNTQDGIRYTFRNTGSRAIRVWTYPARRVGNGKITWNAAELTDLAPGANSTRTLAYLSGPTGPHGEYLLVYAAAYRDKFEGPDMLPTKDGMAVHDVVYRQIKAKMEAEENNYK